MLHHRSLPSDPHHRSKAKSEGRALIASVEPPERLVPDSPQGSRAVRFSPLPALYQPPSGDPRRARGAPGGGATTAPSAAGAPRGGERRTAPGWQVRHGAGGECPVLGQIGRAHV